MRLLIDIPDEQYEYIKKSDKNTFAAVSSKECMLYAIKNGIPYDTSGDLISRSALKKALHDRYAFWGDLTKYEIVMSAMFETFNKLIDNAPTVVVYSKEDMNNAWRNGRDAGYDFANFANKYL